MQLDGVGHVLIMDLSVAPFGLEEAKEKTASKLLACACAVQSLRHQGCTADCCPALAGPSRGKPCSCAAPRCLAVLYPEPA